MSKILIGLSVPSIEEHFDLFVPTDVPLGQLSALCAEALKNLTNGHYCPSGSELLCTTAPNRLLSKEMTLAEFGIENGDHLVIF